MEAALVAAGELLLVQRAHAHVHANVLAAVGEARSSSVHVAVTMVESCREVKSSQVKSPLTPLKQVTRAPTAERHWHCRRRQAHQLLLYLNSLPNSVPGVSGVSGVSGGSEPGETTEHVPGDAVEPAPEPAPSVLTLALSKERFEFNRGGKASPPAPSPRHGR